ncbi:hypothetical protein P7D22_14780 [Lichenihabitans sp. Uapishka_5]|uniref:hypothetical protein n=1 Tax=Lichenihabitans sp. Uapishka_5 TaxID=3037302 RepID=UPI0029E7DC7A|nr:hypothetical protein [Lichenihabitans sp. Uapishka_5]MDX7952433.1 hypothetical protein [Lichenihabitans sp. Uapishka_5]
MPVDVLALDAFVEAMASAQARILIMDPKFNTSNVDVLESAVALTDAPEIRVLTERHGGVERDLIASVVSDLTGLANRRSPRPVAEIRVQWLPVLDKDEFPYIHDRFAIVDEELWHFGATVGGAHPGLNAASRGWNAHDTRAIAFFDELWDIMSGHRARHGHTSGSAGRSGRK